MTKKKIAMVSPRPALPPQASSAARLAQILAELGNDRPYTIIRNHGNKWKIIFSGDFYPVIVKYDGDQPVIIKLEEKDKKSF